MAATGRVRVYVKRQLRLDRLTFDQNKMYRIGTIAVGTVKDRVKQALNDQDARAKPLTKKYAIRKSKTKGGRAYRDLTFTGDMLNSYVVRTLSGTSAVARPDKANEGKARGNNKIERWISYSRKNVAMIVKEAEDILYEAAQQAIKTVPGNIP
jgi:hypothetical protein